MSNFIVITDSTADLPKNYVKENEIEVINLKYIMDGETYGADKELDVNTFYKMMREEKMPTTSQVNPEEGKELFLRLREKNKTMLCLSFSSGLSGTYNSMRIAADEVMLEYPDTKICVIDTLSASLGEGLIVYKAIKLRKEGKTLEEVVTWVEKHKLNFIHMFTVDDLNHLYRGGRVSKTVAFIGTLAGIKPILHVDDEGHLMPVAKVRGRKKSLIALVDHMEQKMGAFKTENDIIFISHGDAKEDAEFVQDEIKKRFGIESYLINYIGPTIGAHSGPGTVALFFMGDKR